jgi:hypothetical protein
MQMIDSLCEQMKKLVIASAAWQSHKTSTEPCLCNLYDEIASFLYSNDIMVHLHLYQIPV